MQAPQVISYILDLNPEIEELFFSTYKQRPHWGVDLHLKKAPLELKLFHPYKEQIVFMEREDFSEEAMYCLISKIDPRFCLCLDSKVETAKGQYHIPMADFRRHVSLKLIREIFERLEIPGIIFKSGRSYHFWGIRIVSETDFRVFLGKMLITTPLVDERYIGHRMVDGYYSLRISCNEHKPIVPYVVDAIELGGKEYEKEN